MRRCDLRLYLVMGITDAHGRRAVDIAREAIRGGVTAVQLREKDAPLGDILRVGGEIREICRASQVPFIVNDRADVALLLGADGVHVGQTDLPGRAVRQLVGRDVWVGVSVSNLHELDVALRSDPDYVGIGAIYGTRSKADAGDAVGPEFLRVVREHTRLPLVGIGGIGPGRAREVMDSGADGVAVISAICGQPDPRAAAAALRAEVDQACDGSRADRK